MCSLSQINIILRFFTEYGNKVFLFMKGRKTKNDVYETQDNLLVNCC